MLPRHLVLGRREEARSPGGVENGVIDELRKTRRVRGRRQTVPGNRDFMLGQHFRAVVSHEMESQEPKALRIEVWSDVACPWCWLGKTHLEEAIRELGVDAEIEMRSYQLAPALTGTRPVEAYLAERYGSGAAIVESQNRLRDMGASVGIAYDFDNAVMANTFDAHRLHHLAKARGFGNELMARLLRAQHGEGADVSTHDTLRRLAVEVGLSAEEIDAVLASDAYADSVRSEIEEGRAIGVQGVPFFVINRKFGISGAQPVDAFVQALRAVREGRA